MIAESISILGGGVFAEEKRGGRRRANPTVITINATEIYEAKQLF
jgi:hypothetical protein